MDSEFQDAKLGNSNTNLVQKNSLINIIIQVGTKSIFYSMLLISYIISYYNIYFAPPDQKNDLCPCPPFFNN